MRPYSTFLFASLMAASPMMVMAAPGDRQCVKGNDIRQIEILTPGNVGAACDLKYTRDAGRNVAIPYHANNNAGFCATKADEIASNLISDGFQCSALIATVQSPAQIEVAAAEVPQEPTAPAQIAEPVDAADITIEKIIQSTEDKQVAAEQGAVIQEAAPAVEIPEVASAADPSPAASVSSTQTQSRGPIDLTAEAKPIAQAAPRPRTSSAGRVVGPAPDPVRVALIEEAEARADQVMAGAPNTTTQATPVAVQEAINAGVSEEANSAKPKPQRTVRPTRVRPAPAIIKGVLNAQAAAWNEGDLEAFMAGYWNNRDLRFVSGDQVTRGWSQTLKRYQKKYAGESMGVLAFEKLDVQMLTDDVAIIVGRFNLDRKSEIDTGTFTLVMRQFDGRWRIVHDHTVADEKVTPAAN